MYKGLDEADKEGNPHPDLTERAPEMKTSKADLQKIVQESLCDKGRLPSYTRALLRLVEGYEQIAYCPQCRYVHPVRG